MPTLINTFHVVPKELFRINNGLSIRLRAATVRPKGKFDLLTESGKVKPKALDPKTYTRPNGASMRPNTPFQRKLVTRIKGVNKIVYCLPAGTILPKDLILVHEYRDHYSLQAAAEMNVDELNTKITAFLTIDGKRLSRDQWLKEYSQPTEIQ